MCHGENAAGASCPSICMPMKSVHNTPPTLLPPPLKCGSEGTDGTMAYKPKRIFKSAAADLAITHLDAMIEVVDYSKAIEHVIASVDRSNIEAWPYPYAILRNVFDQTTH